MTIPQTPPGKTSRDENFPVASVLIHPRHRETILAFYRFARAADDIADAPNLPAEDKLARLDGLERTLLGDSDGEAVWRKGMRDIARRPNVAIKVSGACTLSHEPYPFNDIWDPLARVFDAWGFDRCLWGTDWTRAAVIVDYAKSVDAFRLTDRLSESERAMLMGGACAKVYGWTPKK